MNKKNLQKGILLQVMCRLIAAVYLPRRTNPNRNNTTKAPITAVKIVLKSPLPRETPNWRNNQLPTKAPIIPTTMLPSKPKPYPCLHVVKF